MPSLRPTRKKLDCDNVINRLVFSSAFVGGMNAARFNNFLTQARPNLDLEESVIFVYEGAPAHQYLTVPAPNKELKMLPPYSPFLRVNVSKNQTTFEIRGKS